MISRAQEGIAMTLTVSALVLTAIDAAHAQDAASATAGVQLEDIVVTAQKREQSLQRVPIAIAAISGDSLINRGIASVEDLGRSVTGLQVPNNAGVVQPFLRGIGSTTNTIGAESSVAVYLDGVYFSRLPAGVFALQNVERVEVLKGPQGTLFGRNASGGVMQVITKDPSHNASFRGSLSYARFDTVEGSAYATASLSDSVAADISISGRKQGKGWGKNVTTGGRANYVDYLSIRSKLLIEPSDLTRITLSGMYAFSEAVVQGNTFPGTTRGFISPPFTQGATLGFYDQDNDFPVRQRANLYGGSARIEQELNFARFTSITSYIRTVSDGRADGDYGPRPDFTVVYGGPVKQFTQEFQLSSLANETFDWTLGAFYYNTISSYDGRTVFDSPSGVLNALFGPGGLRATSRSHAKSHALFGQASYEILPRLRFTGGLRYTWDRQTAGGEFGSGLGGPPFLALPDSEDRLNKLTFRAGLDYRVTDAWLLYANVSRGFKSSVYNLLTYDPTPTEAEVLTAYEGGFKVDLFNRRLRLTGAGFYYKIDNPQVQLVEGGTVRFSNAVAGDVKGAELSAEAAISSRLSARAGVSYTDAKYTDYANAPTGTTPDSTAVLVPPYGAVSPLRQIDARGNRLPFAPEWTVNAGADYKVGDFTMSADAFYNDGYYIEPDNFLHQTSFVIVNAQIRYAPPGNLGFRLWGKNIAGEKYIDRATTQAGPSGFPYNPGSPRTYGITIDVNL